MQACGTRGGTEEHTGSERDAHRRTVSQARRAAAADPAAASRPRRALQRGSMETRGPPDDSPSWREVQSGEVPYAPGESVCLCGRAATEASQCPGKTPRMDPASAVLWRSQPDRLSVNLMARPTACIPSGDSWVTKRPSPLGWWSRSGLHQCRVHSPAAPARPLRLTPHTHRDARVGSHGNRIARLCRGGSGRVAPVPTASTVTAIVTALGFLRPVCHQEAAHIPATDDCRRRRPAVDPEDLADETPAASRRRRLADRQDSSSPQRTTAGGGRVSRS